MTDRIEFSKRTKICVAGRAGYRCSIPTCDQITIGPGAKADEIALFGVAAHIYSASEGGPRGFGGLTAADLKSPENAIWVCANHGRLIDANSGMRYPAPLLRTYKELQETRISRELRGIYAPFGWFHEVTVVESPVFAPSTTIQLGKVTLIIGGNGSGKTALCEWLIGLGDPSALSRWQDHNDDDPWLKVRITLFNPEKLEARLELRPDSSVAYFVGDNEVPYFPYPLHFVNPWPYLMSPMRHREYNNPVVDEVALMADILKVHPATVRNLIDDINQHGEGSVRNLRLVQQDGLQLVADLEGEQRRVDCFRGMSGSQQARVALEFAIALARHSAQYAPTMLMLKGIVEAFDPYWLQRYCDFLLRPDHLFQTIIESASEIRNLRGLRLMAWKFVRLKGHKTGVTVDQQPYLN